MSAGVKPGLSIALARVLFILWTTARHRRRPNPRTAAASSRMGSQRDDDHAGQIAEKLLEGWTLLAEYCPMEGCTCPLLRSRDGRAGIRGLRSLLSST
jgi:hypothetical protein